MKFYETADVNFYVVAPSSWKFCCKYGTNKSWGNPKKPCCRSMNVYTDYQAAWLPVKFTRHFYYFEGDKTFHKSRTIPWACLPMLYGNGYRFVKLQDAAPVNFRCAEMPMSLKEVHEKTERMMEEEIAREKALFLKKAFKNACKKAAKKKKPGVKK